ncbi:hypothetical protein M431DRAFT_177562 [Trichoderma harzianum CBS 226.95]|uniref:Secreted protein n=1 Tax=Trichoderma harzianum CBS 226.95 TaxID=983964 RepID=A0A2T4ATD8_TRIHA|nr:hypothetical protein M431DRAFT_177562 [Trichoderma harzianum CBS 226.95]PTB60335.1 hypothetical protein M431DRAFT_177562 [Trichoderma harzianum CBS 226.95]
MLCLCFVMAGLMWGDVCRYPWLPRSVEAIIGREPGHTICRQESGRPRYDARLSSVWSNRLLAHGRLPRAPLSVFPQTNEGTGFCFNRRNSTRPGIGVAPRVVPDDIPQINIAVCRSRPNKNEQGTAHRPGRN